MDSGKHAMHGNSPQCTSSIGALSASHGASSALAVVSMQMANLCASLENVFGHLIREQRSFKERLYLPIGYPLKMLKETTSLITTYCNPFNFKESYNKSLERVGSVSRRLSGVVENLIVSSASAKTALKSQQCTFTHLNQLANQLQQLAENVANLQEANEEFRLKYHHDSLLAEVGDMKGYLELLYQHLRNEELKKLHMEEENALLRYTAVKHSIDGRTSGIYTRRESNETSTCSLEMSSTSQLIIDKKKNPLADIETSMNEFQLTINSLYQDGVIAWVRPPKKGDEIVFKFHDPVLLQRFKIGTGHYEYPTNKLSEATVEILPTARVKTHELTEPVNYLIVGSFDRSGMAHGVIDWQTVGTVQSLRVSIHSDHHHWVILSEMVLETTPKEETSSQSDEFFECW